MKKLFFIAALIMAATCAHCQKVKLYQIKKDSTIDGLIIMSTTNLKPFAVYKKNAVIIYAVDSSTVYIKYPSFIGIIDSRKPILINGQNRQGYLSDSIIEFLSEIFL